MSEKEELKRVAELLHENKAKEAQLYFSKIIPDETTEYWLIKGKLKQKFQHWSEALNAFTKVLEMEPENAEARNQFHIVQNILNFWNPEMFNP